jgi:hypothetical protein
MLVTEARFDDRHSAVEDLEASGILVRLRKGGAIGFSHQTVFEHALARNFARAQGGLSKYVAERQASLFVRPKLWVSLGYLRDVDDQAYEREINYIWLIPNLRHHLRQLVVEFIGQQNEPSDLEELLLVPLLLDRSSPLRAAALAAISGSRGWFNRLEATAITPIMREEKPPVAVVAVLSKARDFVPRNVLALIQTNWLGYPDKDFLSWLVVEACPLWDAAVLNLATKILRRTAIEAFRVDHLASRILSENPFAAFSLIRAALDKSLDQLETEQTSKRAKTPFPRDGTQDEQIAWHIRNDRGNSFKELFEHESHYFDLPQMAQSHPSEFMRVLWPWYVRLLRASIRESRPSENGYPGDGLLSLTRQSVGHLPPLADALLEGVSAFAKESPDHFLGWVSENESIELLSVQRLIARGFLASLNRYVDGAADFLLADHRRLMLGDHTDRFNTTKALISGLAALLPAEKLRTLESAIIAFESLPRLSKDRPAAQRRARLKHIRSDQLRLLRAFPREALSDEARRRVPEEERALGAPPDWDSYSTGMQAIGSPMSATAMERAKDADVLKMLDEVPDEAEWDHPRDFMRGGNIQLSQEFANFASLFSDRAARIIRALRPDRHERAAGYAVAAIAGFNINSQPGASTVAKPELALDLLRELSTKGFDNIEFRGAVARAVSGLAARRFPIPEDIVALLEAWLVLPQEHQSSERKEELNSQIGTLFRRPKKDAPDSNQFSHSIVWDQRTVMLPAGNFPVLDALTLALLTRRPADTERWLKILNAHLDREEDLQVWRALLRYLQHLAGAPHKDACNFISRLFRKYPKLLETEDAALLIAQTQSWVDDSRLRSWIKRLGERASPIARQAYGELVGLVNILRPAEQWFSEAAKTIVSSNGTKLLGSRVGLAFAAANLWGNPEHSDSAVELLVQLIPKADAKTARAILDSFRIVDELRPDGPTTKLLQSIVDHPNVIGLAGSSFLVERLETLLPHEAELVARLALVTTEQWKDSLGDIRTSIAATTPELVNLALTLHRLGGPVREEGTTLFEKLLQIEAYGAREALHDIDRPLRSSVWFLKT